MKITDCHIMLYYNEVRGWRTIKVIQGEKKDEFSIFSKPSSFGNITSAEELGNILFTEFELGMNLKPNEYAKNREENGLFSLLDSGYTKYSDIVKNYFLINVGKTKNETISIRESEGVNSGYTMRKEFHKVELPLDCSPKELGEAAFYILSKEMERKKNKAFIKNIDIETIDGRILTHKKLSDDYHDLNDNGTDLYKYYLTEDESAVIYIGFINYYGDITSENIYNYYKKYNPDMYNFKFEKSSSDFFDFGFSYETTDKEIIEEIFINEVDLIILTNIIYKDKIDSITRSKVISDYNMIKDSMKFK